MWDQSQQEKNKNNTMKIGNKNENCNKKKFYSFCIKSSNRLTCVKFISVIW